MIDHERRLIFIHIARTGGSSVETALSGNDWWPGSAYDKHMSCSQARDYHGWKVWDRYRKFTIVRHPLSRLVSMYATGWWGNGPFEEWLRHLKPHINETYRTLLQSEVLDLPLTCLLRYETLPQDWVLMCDGLALGPIALPHLKKSEHKPFMDYYSPTSLALVRRKFAPDLDRFGYH